MDKRKPTDWNWVAQENREVDSLLQYALEVWREAHAPSEVLPLLESLTARVKAIKDEIERPDRERAAWFARYDAVLDAATKSGFLLEVDKDERVFIVDMRKEG